LTGDLRARAADANILPLLFPEIDHAAGLLTANATSAGRWHCPSSTAASSWHAASSIRIASIRDARAGYRRRSGKHRAALPRSGPRGEGQLEAQGQLMWRGGESRGDLRVRARICCSQICPTTASLLRPICTSSWTASGWTLLAT
jgi:hypothetical protein